MSVSERYPCPCCGYLVFDQLPGSSAICPICCWTDDIAQLAFPMMPGGGNRVSLCEAQANFGQTFVSDARFVAKVRDPLSTEKRDEGWRPFDRSKDRHLWWESPEQRQWWKPTDDPRSLYWWRPGFWLLQETPGWRFANAVQDGESYLIDGVDVWKHKWASISGGMVIVKDPHHGQIFHFPAYEIVTVEKRVIFAAGEFSNGIWGFYLPDSSKA